MSPEHLARASAGLTDAARSLSDEETVDNVRELRIAALAYAQAVVTERLVEVARNRAREPSVSLDDHPARAAAFVLHVERQELERLRPTATP